MLVRAALCLILDCFEDAGWTLERCAILLEWRHLLDISLSQLEDDSSEPPYLFMAPKYAENVADDIALLLTYGERGSLQWSLFDCVMVLEGIRLFL